MIVMQVKASTLGVCTRNIFQISCLSGSWKSLALATMRVLYQVTITQKMSDNIKQKKTGEIRWPLSSSAMIIRSFPWVTCQKQKCASTKKRIGGKNNQIACTM